jgi:hypothetical protein
MACSSEGFDPCSIRVHLWPEYLPLMIFATDGHRSNTDGNGGLVMRHPPRIVGEGSDNPQIDKMDADDPVFRGI